jgi:hypothetical protein
MLNIREIKSRLNSGIAWYHYIEYILPSVLIFKNINIKMYRTTAVPVVECEYELWLLTLREKHRIKFF